MRCCSLIVRTRERHLARRLLHLRGTDAVVLALPRGGVPVAFEVARELRAPLDVIVVRKLGVPFQPEYGFGAIGEDGARMVDDRVVRLAGLTRQEIASVEMRERDWLNRRLGRLRGDRPPVPLAGRTAVVVDDGDRDRLDGPRGLPGGQGARRQPGERRGTGGLGAGRRVAAARRRRGDLPAHPGTLRRDRRLVRRFLPGRRRGGHRPARPGADLRGAAERYAGSRGGRGGRRGVRLTGSLVIPPGPQGRWCSRTAAAAAGAVRATS
jgi:hypothetical protein